VATLSEIDLEEYEATIEAHIQRVEQFLVLPAGTLADIRHDSDYLKILKMHATLEPLLNHLLEASVTRALQHPKVHFPGGDALASHILDSRLEKKIKLAVDRELISADDALFIRMVGKIRNHYAHSIQNMSLSIEDVAVRINPDDRGMSVERILYGISKETQTAKHGPIVRRLMRPFIFHRFAQLVGKVVLGIAPPPVPFGILSGMFGSSAPVGQLTESLSDDSK
jgi:hypothetical protein